MYLFHPSYLPPLHQLSFRRPSAIIKRKHSRKLSLIPVPISVLTSPFPPLLSPPARQEHAWVTNKNGQLTEAVVVILTFFRGHGMNTNKLVGLQTIEIGCRNDSADNSKIGHAARIAHGRSQVSRSGAQHVDWSPLLKKKTNKAKTRLKCFQASQVKPTCDAVLSV